MKNGSLRREKKLSQPKVLKAYQELLRYSETGEVGYIYEVYEKA
jgi:hypothetical protein